MKILSLSFLIFYTLNEINISLGNIFLFILSIYKLLVMIHVLIAFNFNLNYFIIINLKEIKIKDCLIALVITTIFYQQIILEILYGHPQLELVAKEQI